MTAKKKQLSATQHSLPMTLLRAREVVMQRFRSMLNAHDITEQQWRVIRVLEEVDAIDASALAAAACVLPPSLTRILRALEKRGFIAVERDNADGRRTRISLTSAGQNFIHVVSPESLEIYADIESKLGEERIQRILSELNVLVDALRRA